MSHLGREHEVAVAIEGTRGTAETTPQKWVRKVSADIIPKNTKAIDDSTRGVLEESEGSRVVREWFEGPIGGILHADLIGYFLLNLYGSVTSTLVAASVYSHAFSLDQDIDHPTLSIFRKDGAVESQVYGGGVVSALEISASTEDFVRFTSTVMARNEGVHAESASYDTEYDFIGKDITVKVASTEAGLAGASATKAKTLAIRYDTGAISDFVFGSNNPDDIANGRFSIEIEISKNYEDTTLEALFKSGDYRYMQVSIVGDADLGSSNNPSMTWVFNRVQVQDWERSGDPDAFAEETVTLKAYYNATDAEQSTLTVQNITEFYDSDLTAPAAPTGLAADAISTSEINLNWDDNGESDLDHYEVYGTTSTGFTPGPTNLLDNNVTESAYSDTGLAEGTAYYYKVIAVDDDGNKSTASDEATVQTETDGGGAGGGGEI